MKILYISPKIPYPLSDGGNLRVFNHIKHLSKKHNIISLSFIRHKEELRNIRELRKHCSVETIMLSKGRSLFNSFIGLLSKKPLRIWYLKDRKFREKARKIGKEADLVIIQALRMSPYSFHPDKTILDLVDTPSLQIKRALQQESFLWKLIWKLELPRILQYEKKISKRFRHIVVASESDRKALGRGVVLKNGTKISTIQRKEVSENSIMFLGNMEYQPNIDAVYYFVHNIFPLIQKKIPDAKFYIVGKNPESVKKFASRSIIVTGFVDDISVYFSRCKVFAAPLRLGSGIQNKVLEALNYEIPIVTTSIVNEGVEAEDGKEIIIADNPRAFADEVVGLLKDQKLRRKIALKGKRFLKKHYSWDNMNKELTKLISI